eukprot:5838656-Prorocentrum_lima.AAC.1
MKGQSMPLAIENQLPDDNDEVVFTGPVDQEEICQEIDAAIARAQAAGQPEDAEAVEAFGSAAPAEHPDDLREAMIAAAEAAEARGEPLTEEPS